MDEGTDTIIYKGREIERDGVLRWEWCPFVYLGTKTCSAIYVVQHSMTDRRLWFGYGTNTAYVKLFDNAPVDGEFASSGWVRSSYFDAGNRSWDKLLQYLITETENCTADITVQPKYLKDKDTSATNLTPSIRVNGTNQNFLINELSAKRVAIQLNLTTNSSSVTPVVSLFELRGVVKPEVIRIHDVTYVIGSSPNRSAKLIRDFLRSGRSSTSFIKFADLRYKESVTNRTYHWVVIMPSYPQEVEIKHERGRQPEIGIRVRFQEIDYTIS